MAKKATKPTGVILGEHAGLTVSVDTHFAKTPRGKHRVWVSIRQTGETTPWRQAETLAYHHGADIMFEVDQETMAKSPHIWPELLPRKKSRVA